MRSYIGKLTRFPYLRLGEENLAEMAKDYFKLVIAQVGDSWRRLCQKQEHGFPFLMWRICGLEGDILYSKFSELQHRLAESPCCVDMEFSLPLLRHVPCPLDPTNRAHQLKVLEVQAFLEDCAIYCPISTDQVEALHGFMQSKLHRFRGNKPTDEVAREISLWSNITASYKALRDYIWDRTGDMQAKRRLAAQNRGHTPNGITWENIRAMAKDEDHMHSRLKQKKLCGCSPATKKIGEQGQIRKFYWFLEMLPDVFESPGWMMTKLEVSHIQYT